MSCQTDILPPFAKLWQNKDPFVEAFALEGEEFRKVKNRRTFRVEVEGMGFFVKLHRGVGWGEIFKNLLQFKLPVTGAGNEYRALAELHRLQIPTMTTAAFGERNFNPAAKESFLITRELTGVITLEDLGREKIDPLLRHRLIAALAASAGRMHRGGINHRDCYICHYMLDKSTAQEREPVLYVIDLHRAQIRKKVPFRYHVKDVGGLLFSAWSAGLTGREALRFVRLYSQRNLREELAVNRRFWSAVVKCAAKLYRKENHGALPPWMQL